MKFWLNKQAESQSLGCNGTLAAIYMPNIQILVSTCWFSLKKTQDTLDKQPFPDVEQSTKAACGTLCQKSTPILMEIRVSKDSSRQLERVSIVKFGTICLPKSKRVITGSKTMKEKWIKSHKCIVVSSQKILKKIYLPPWGMGETVFSALYWILKWQKQAFNKEI